MEGGSQSSGEGTGVGVDRLLVAVGSSPSSAHLVRWAGRRASALGAQWFAVHIDTGKPPGEAEREELGRHLELARKLGARVVTIAAEDVVEALVSYARGHDVTEIVVGRSGELGRRLGTGKTVAARLLRQGGDLAVAVVRERGRELTGALRFPSFEARSEFPSMLVALAAVAAATGIGLGMVPLVGYRPVFILFLLTILGLSFIVSRWAVLAAAAASAAILPFLFLPPLLNFGIASLEDILAFILYVATAVSLGSLMSRVRRNERLLGARERRLELVYDFSQALSVKQSLDEIVRAGLDHASRAFGGQAVIFLKAEDGKLECRTLPAEPALEEGDDHAAARWCLEHRTPCGRHTDTFRHARFHYVPLVSPDSVVGVFGVRQSDRRRWMPDHEHTLELMARTLALSLERELLAEANKRNLMARESERLGKLLLNTVSHQLRTPLTTIKGSITAMMEQDSDPGLRAILLAETLEAAERLNSTVENILSMNRLESGMLRLKRSDTDLADLAGVAADAVRRQTACHPFTVRVPDGAPPVYVDIVLMVQVIVNLVSNVVSHTPQGTSVDLQFVVDGNDLGVTVSDTGPGVPPEELPRLFETFYRGRRAATGGVGLGLSICKGIVAAHGGTITARLRPAGGLVVHIVLPGCVRDRETES